MKKKFMVALLGIFVAVLGVLILTGCKTKKVDVKIGILTYSLDDLEVGDMILYLKKVVGELGAEVIVSAAAQDDAAAVVETEKLISNGANAIIAFIDSREIVDVCIDAKVYYIRAAGIANQSVYDYAQNNKYFLGSIGPDVNSMEQVAGYNMTKHFLDAGVKKLLISTGLLFQASQMHVARYKGVVQALEEYGFTHVKENGYNWTTTGSFTSPDPSYTVVALDMMMLEEYPDIYAAWGTALLTIEFEQVIALTSGYEIFSQTLEPLLAVPGLVHNVPGVVKVATFSSFNQSYAYGFSTPALSNHATYGTTGPLLNYLIGKFTSSVGSSLIACINAVEGNGDQFRQNGKAFKIFQDYWYADTPEKALQMYATDTLDAPALTSDTLKNYILSSNKDTNYALYAAFITNSSYEVIKGLKEQN
jgi:hypothetical protein